MPLLNLHKFFMAALLFLAAAGAYCGMDIAYAMENSGKNGGNAMRREIVLAGGCFWGVQEYFSRLPGVLSAESGYAQSNVPYPDYRAVCSGDTNAAEAVKIVYDPAKIGLESILRHFFHIIDPTSKNRQGNDIGTQYRTGIYYADASDVPIAKAVMAQVRQKYDKPLAVELEPLRNFYSAEEYHQDYLKKNPGGYCHISFAGLKDPALAPKPDTRAAGPDVSDMARHVTRENGTEPPFTGKYWNFYEPGIYVDIYTGQPLFSSKDKFPSSCGWPAFARPIQGGILEEKEDKSHGMERIEVRSPGSNSHLGHVFDDGPKELGGLRYCINSAAIRFIPLKDMEKEGYGQYVKSIEGGK